MTSNREWTTAVVLAIVGVVLLAVGLPWGALALVYPGWLFFVAAVGEGTRRGMAAARSDELIATLDDDEVTQA